MGEFQITSKSSIECPHQGLLNCTTSGPTFMRQESLSKKEIKQGRNIIDCHHMRKMAEEQREN
jgi:hypothetical protein